MHFTYLRSQHSADNFPVQVEREVQTAEYLFKYLLYLPEGFEKQGKEWPLLIFLHGSGERGNDLSLVTKHGPPKVAFQMNLPFIIISPQCPAGRRWEAKSLQELIDSSLQSLPVDRSRIYLTGLSMGGFGTWSLAAAMPDFFAALAPVCGAGDVNEACKIKNAPAWVFHGELDNVVPVARSVEMVNALRECGGNVIFTNYLGITHDSWTMTYSNPELYKWFLSHSK